MRLALFAILAVLLIPAKDSPQAWVEKSNQNAQALLNVTARYSPESASFLGVPGYDEQVSKPSAGNPPAFRRDMAEAVKTLEERAASEQDPLVKQDLEILIEAGRRDIRASEIRERNLLPYTNAAARVFTGLQSLLSDQTPEDRRPASVVRLKRYAGVDEGYTPFTTLAENLFREKEKTSSLLGPAKAEIEQDLTNLNSYTTGIGLLFEKYKMKGYEDAYAKLKTQLAEYSDFVRKEVLPKARTDFRLPPDVYSLNLEDAGVDYTPQELTTLAHKSFTEIQAEMQTIAAKVAREKNLPSSDYRDVVKALKKDQLQADQVMPLYRGRLAQIEAILRREHLVTLPARQCIIRIATAAETAQQPAPHMMPPPLINNHGQQGQFVLPGGTVGPDGKPLKYDDFTFSAASWTLTAHEARPGHELQFAAMVERGVSQARAIFSFNSTNVEGWGLYSEWFMLPYMPDDGKLISLQLRLLRAARAFLDPELQQGKVTREQALRVLKNDVVLSDAFATEEVDRFTFRMPGQAVSYFDGYTRLREIRSAAEQAMGSKFDAGKFHDFVLSQGLLPPNLLRKAVMQDFVHGS